MLAMNNLFVPLTLLLLFSVSVGFSGGFMFGKMEQQLTEAWNNYFVVASILMLMQDATANIACIVLILWFGISLDPVGGPVYPSLFFFLLIFISPACGFLWAKNSC